MPALIDILLFPITNVWAATFLLPGAFLALEALAPGLPRSPESFAAFCAMGLVPCAFFYAVSFVYFLLDTLPPAAWVAARKFQGARGAPPPGAYAAALAVSLRSWLVGLAYIALLAYKVGPALALPAPSAPWRAADFLAHFPVYLLAVDACFFATHRLLHTPLLFARVHKFHHAFSAPFALASVYAHPFEHFFSNVLSISAGPLLMRSHPYSAALWGCLAALSTLNSHSGFAFAGISDGHDWHHRDAGENFGAGLAIFDKLLGSDARYRRHKEEAKKAA